MLQKYNSLPYNQDTAPCLCRVRQSASAKGVRKMRATIKDVAKECGVSVSAVSMALSDKPSRISEDTRQKVRGGSASQLSSKQGGAQSGKPQKPDDRYRDE